MNRTIRSLFVLTALLALSVFFVPSAGAASSKVPTWGKPWPKGTVKIYDASPAKYRWAVDYAVKHYSEIGAKVKLVKVKKRKQANVVVTENLKIRSAGLAKTSYRGKGPGRGTVELNMPDYNRYEMAKTVVHEFGHTFGLDHPNSGKLCAMMNQQMERACKWYKDDGVNWLCGVVQSPDLKALQKLYGKRKNKAPKRWCKIPASDILPSVPSDLAYNGDGAWVTDQWGDDAVRMFSLSLTFTPYTMPLTDLIWSADLSFEFFSGSCAEAASAGWTKETGFEDPVSGSNVTAEGSIVNSKSGGFSDRIARIGAGGTVCYRLRANNYAKLGADPPPVYSAPAEVVVPADPNPIVD